MKQLIAIILLVLICACSNKPSQSRDSHSELLTTWVKLERDTEGYLIYDPCNGTTTSITIAPNTAIFDLSQETPDTLKIASINILNATNTIQFIASRDNYSVNAVLKSIDLDQKLWLLKWELTPKYQPNNIRKGKMMVTKREFVKDFRFVDQPCDHERVAEKEFLPIEFD
jgi:hypothetical protein